jgi:hypothetical protein
VANACGKLLWQAPVANSCGKLLWQTPVANSCGKLLWQTHVANSCGKLDSVAHLRELGTLVDLQQSLKKLDKYFVPLKFYIPWYFMASLVFKNRYYSTVTSEPSSLGLNTLYTVIARILNCTQIMGEFEA